ncbi:MAG TPA: helix-turn-helix domain-containing protein [Chryseolinea sp.]
MRDVRLIQYFKPVQPTLRLHDGASYRESIPDARLAPYIYCYWQLKSEYQLNSSFSYRVIPDGCIDIFFDTNNSDDMRVMGFSTSHTQFTLDTSFYYAGVRFLPGAFPLIFGVDASSLTDRDEVLSDVTPEAARHLTGCIAGQSSFDDIAAALDVFFLKKLAGTRDVIDRRFYNAVAIILKEHGTLNLEAEIDTGLSPRQLRRLFEFYVGTSPKIFSKVVRFQYFFQLLGSSRGTTYNKLFLEAGYYDQPHFNRDFKTFFGLTPTEALRK